MLVKISILYESSVRIYNKITTCSEDDNLKSLLSRLEENGQKVLDTTQILEVQSGKSFLELSSLDLSSIEEISLSELKTCFNAALLHVKVKVKTAENQPPAEPEEIIQNAATSSNSTNNRTLMDVVRSESFLPKLTFPEKKELIKSFLDNGNTDLLPEIFLSSNKKTSVNGKSLMLDSITIKVNSLIKGVTYNNQSDFHGLLTSVRELIWYIGPHKHKFVSHNCPIPKFFENICLFNDPKRHKHTAGSLDRHRLDLLLGGVTTQLEKSYVFKQSFSTVKEQFDKVTESVVKYCDFLDVNRVQATSSRNAEEPLYEQSVFELPHQNESRYTISREKVAIENILERLENKDFYDAISIDDFFSESRHLRYTFVNNLKTKGLFMKNCILFAQHYAGAKGNVYFLWKEDPSCSTHETLRNSTIQEIVKNLPKYFSRGHRQRVKKLTENLMLDRISCAEFRALYYELTGDQSASETKATQEVDDRMRTIMNNLTPGLAKDLRVNNSKKCKFDLFWDICSKILSDITAVDDRRHCQGSEETGDVVVNMAIAISAKSLYGQCREKALETLSEEDIPSLSWFRFQFWPKDSRTHTALNYTGRFKVKYMVQQRMIRKHHDDAHYCACIYKYLRSMAVTLRDVSNFICTDDKHKVPMGEPGYPLSALPRGRRVLVATNESYQVGDHDFTKINVIPTVVLINKIPGNVEDSWYRGKPYVMLKITALSPSTALRNAREMADILISHHGSKEAVPPVLFLYTDGGPEHRTNFVSVKIAMIALQKFLDLDQVVIARTAPGHSFRNPAEKINCILNLGLYDIGCMRQKSPDLEFESLLSKCDSLKEQRSLVAKNPDKNEKLFFDACFPCLNLIKLNFEQLTLKEEKFSSPKAASDNDVKEIFTAVDLDEDLQAHDGTADLNKRPKLTHYLSHCCRQRTYFLSIKKCGNRECNTCKLPRLTDDDFQRLKHLPDPMPSTDGKHYKPYDEVVGTATDESHMPSLKINKNKHNIPFNPLQQHAINTRLLIECSECNKPRLVFAQKKLTPEEMRKFKSAVSGLFYTCGSSVQEFVLNGNSAQKKILEKTFVKENHTCMKPVEIIYYSCKIHPDCCTWCGSKRKLSTVPNTYPICAGCKSSHKQAVLRKRGRQFKEK